MQDMKKILEFIKRKLARLRIKQQPEVAQISYPIPDFRYVVDEQELAEYAQNESERLKKLLKYWPPDAEIIDECVSSRIYPGSEVNLPLEPVLKWNYESVEEKILEKFGRHVAVSIRITLKYWIGEEVRNPYCSVKLQCLDEKEVVTKEQYNHIFEVLTQTFKDYGVQENNTVVFDDYKVYHLEEDGSVGYSIPRGELRQWFE